MRGGTTSESVAWDKMMRPPPPRPEMRRPLMSISMFTARPHTTLPAAYSVSAAMSRRLRPIRSPSLP